jgi:hypothetical protein
MKRRNEGIGHKNIFKKEKIIMADQGKGGKLSLLRSVYTKKHFSDVRRKFTTRRVVRQKLELFLILPYDNVLRYG